MIVDGWTNVIIVIIIIFFFFLKKKINVETSKIQTQGKKQNKTKKIKKTKNDKCLQTHSPKADMLEKKELSFGLYDMNNDGFIDREEVRQMVVAALEEIDMRLSKSQIQGIVEYTFQTVDLDRNNIIDFKEYCAFCDKNPRFFKHMPLLFLCLCLLCVCVCVCVCAFMLFLWHNSQLLGLNFVENSFKKN